MNASLQLCRYPRDGQRHRHGHLQVVLAVHGALEIEVDGRGGRVEPNRAVVIAAATDHDQSGDGDHRFVLLNCAEALLGGDRVEQLRQRPFLPVAPCLHRLAAFLDRHWPGPEPVADALLQHCLPRLLAELAADPVPLQRLHRLCEALRAQPGQPWTVADMAARIELRPSQLHALFRQTFAQTPQQWLAALRLQRACRQLAQSPLPIARIALDNGWSEQSALTRSLRRATGLTPAAYRRLNAASQPGSRLPPVTGPD